MLPAYKNNFWFVHNNKRIISYRIIWINVMSHTFLLLYSTYRYTKVGSFSVSDVYIKYIKIRKFWICLLIYFFFLSSSVMVHTFHIISLGGWGDWMWELDCEGVQIVYIQNTKLYIRDYRGWTKYIYSGFEYGQTDLLYHKINPTSYPN